MRVAYVCQHNLSLLIEYVTTLLSTCCRVFFNGVFVKEWTTVDTRIKEPVFLRILRLRFHRLNLLNKIPN